MQPNWKTKQGSTESEIKELDPNIIFLASRQNSLIVNGILQAINIQLTSETHKKQSKFTIHLED